MSEYRLRPHHALCISFFEGKGYSEDFVRNMTEVITQLDSEDPPLILSPDADIICTACPNNNKGRCLTDEKVHRYDRAVLEQCGIAFDDSIHWHELSKMVSTKIVDEGKLSQICGDCCWHHICRNKA